MSECQTRPTMPLQEYCRTRLGLSSNAAYRAAKNGEIPGAFQIGSKWLVPVALADQKLGIAPVPQVLQAAE
jgi:hypothetical protein